MDLAIEKGRLEEAVEMSEKLSQREFASKLATAFDCRDYVKRKTVSSLIKEGASYEHVRA